MGFIKIVIFLSLFSLTSCDIYSSHVHLQGALSRARALKEVDVIREYIARLSPLLEQYRDVLKQHIVIKDLLHSKKFDGNHPVSMFTFMRRSQDVVGKLAALQNGTIPVLNRTMFTNRTKEHRLPTQEDLNSSISGLLRLQDIYRLKAKDMAAGKVSNFHTDPLSLYECLEIAKHAQSLYSGLKAKNDKSFKAYLAIEWLNAAELKVTNVKEAEQFLEVSNVVYSIIRCECSPNNIDRYTYFGQKFPALNESVTSYCKRSLNNRCRTLPKAARKETKYTNFDSLCRGETVEPFMESGAPVTPERHKRCRYVHNNDPFLLLKPIKVEELNLLHPYIVILHDIIDETEIWNLKFVATPYLDRGPVKKKAGFVITDTKISKQYFVPMEKCKKVIPNFRRRIAGVTGMHLRSFEKIQVVNYGTGGFYNLHVDLFTPDVVENFNDAMNNRLVTTVVYLHDVPEGGETTFPAVGVKVKPKRGNAVLFFNMKRNGDLLKDSVHSSCPVVYGEKWVANQWIGRNGQEFNYPCSIDKKL